MPAYNEAGNLPTLLSDLTATLRTLADRWEVIVVDDGSRDGTPAAMQPWLSAPGVRYVRLSRNFGKEAALSAGLDRAQGDAVVLMDADGQHPVDMLATMVEAWRGGADMVCTVRRSRAEPGCISHAVHRDVEDPLRLVFVEQWADRAALLAHFAVPASRAFVKAAAGFASAAPAMTLFEVDEWTP